MNAQIRHRNLAVAALLVSIALVTPAAWSQSRAGTIEEVRSIENRGDDESKRTRMGRSIGERVGTIGGLAASVGLARSGHAEAGLVGMTVANTHGDRIGGAIGERVAGEGPTTRYMVKIRLDEGRLLSLTQLREQMDGLDVGSRVRVEGAGDQARLEAE